MGGEIVTLSVNPQLILSLLLEQMFYDIGHTP